MKAKEIAIWIGVLVVLVGGLWLLIAAVNNSPSPLTKIQKTAPDVTKDDYVRGDKSAKVTLIEYGDFQCPACGLYYPVIKKVEGDFKNDLKVVYRFFPLTNIHQNAMVSAQAAYAAGLQGKFWEMHDMLYENQNSWSDTQARDIFVDYANKLGLNSKQFESDIDNEPTKNFITDQVNKAIALGVNSTPTFFVNGKYIQNPAGYEEFKKIIQDALTK